MRVRCGTCNLYFEDEFRMTYCPHDTFAANDGNNNFAHHPEAYLGPLRRKTTRSDFDDCGTPHLDEGD
jgi:hypothetical protein